MRAKDIIEITESTSDLLEKDDPVKAPTLHDFVVDAISNLQKTSNSQAKPGIIKNNNNINNTQSNNLPKNQIINNAHTNNQSINNLHTNTSSNTSNKQKQNYQ